LDDALSSVDTLTEERILTHLAGMMRGRIVEMGTHAELIAAGG
jgi:ABC-type multidrug transport system fused ATPase/permease subunit